MANEDLYGKYGLPDPNAPAGAPAAAAPLDVYAKYGLQKPKEEGSGILRRTVGDLGVGLAEGAVGLPQMALGLADAVTGGAADRAGRYLRAGADRAVNYIGDAITGNKIGRDYGITNALPSQGMAQTVDTIGQYYSPEAKAALPAVHAKAQEYGKIGEDIGSKIAGDTVGGTVGSILGETAGSAYGAATNPSAALAVLGQSAPSMLGAEAVVGRVAAGVGARAAAKTVGNAAAKEAAARAAVEHFVESKAGTAVQSLAEGGVAGGQNADQAKTQLMQMPEKELAKLQPYQDLLAQGMKPEEARLNLAEKVGARTALYSGALSSAAGPIAGKFGARAGAKLFGGAAGKGVDVAGGFRKGVQNTLKEGGQETIQSGAEQFGQNVAMRTADPNQPLSEGVGEQAGTGMVAGLGMGAAVSAATRGGHGATTPPPPPGTPPGTPPGEVPAAPPLNVTAPEILAHAQDRLAQLDAKANGTPEQTVPGPDGTPITVPGAPKQYLTPQEKAERDWLTTHADNPERLARGYGATLVRDPVDETFAQQHGVPPGGLTAQEQAELDLAGVPPAKPAPPFDAAQHYEGFPPSEPPPPDEPPPPPGGPPAAPETFDQEFQRLYGVAPGGLTTAQVSEMLQKQQIAQLENGPPVAKPFNADEHFAGLQAEETARKAAVGVGPVTDAKLHAPDAGPLSRTAALAVDTPAAAIVQTQAAQEQAAPELEKQQKEAAKQQEVQAKAGEKAQADAVKAQEKAQADAVKQQAEAAKTEKEAKATASAGLDTRIATLSKEAAAVAERAQTNAKPGKDGKVAKVKPTPLHDAMTVATAPHFNPLAAGKAVKTALEEKRPDVASVIVERANRAADEAEAAVPSVPQGHASYAPLAAVLKTIATNARRTANRLAKQAGLTAPAVAPAGKAAAQTFTTEKGSTYVVHEDGTTTRDKAARPEHPGEQGPQPRSGFTGYVPLEEARKLDLIQATNPHLVVMTTDPESKHVGLMFADGPHAGKLIAGTVIPYSTTPTVGLIPIEGTRHGITGGTGNEFDQVHFGNKITKVGTGEQAQGGATQPVKAVEQSTAPPAQTQAVTEKKATAAVKRWAPGDPLYRGSPEPEARLQRRHFSGVFFGAEPHTAAQYGAVQEYSTPKDLNLADEHDRVELLRDFYMRQGAKTDEQADEWAADPYDGGGPLMFPDDAWAKVLKDAGFDGHTHGGDVFIADHALDKVEPAKKAATADKYSIADEPAAPAPRPTLEEALAAIGRKPLKPMEKAKEKSEARAKFSVTDDKDAKPTIKSETVGETRGERKTGRLALSGRQRLKLTGEGLRLGLSREEIAALHDQARKDMARFPPSDGWSPLEVNTVRRVKKTAKDGTVSFKNVIEYVKQQYGFNRAPEGVTEWPKKMSDAGVKAIVDLYDRAKRGDKVAQNIVAHASWYRAMASRLRAEFGAAGDFYADLLGATSPNTPVKTNWKFSIDLIKQFSRGQYKTEMEAFSKWVAEGNDVGKFPAAEKIRQLSGKLYGMNSTNAMLAVANLWRNIQPGTAPKARNFALNLIGQSNMATIDVWAARFMRRMANSIRGAVGDFPRIPTLAETAVTGNWNAKGTAVTGEFGFGAKVMQQMSEDLAKRGIDLTPPDLQAVAWFVEKALWTRNGWTSSLGEGGSFETEADKAALQRFLAAWSVQTTEAPPDARVALEGARLLATVQSDEDVVAARAVPTIGMYDAESSERSFDTELTVKPGWSPWGFIGELTRIAKENNQDSFFFSRVLKPDEEHANARPGVEIYFKTEQDMERVLPKIQELVKAGQQGFTLTVDPRSEKGAGATADRFNGIRIQYVPEFQIRFGGPDADALKSGDKAKVDVIIREQAAALERVAEQVMQDEGVALAMTYRYDTLVVTKEEYDDYAQAGTGSQREASRGNLRAGQPLHEVLAGAARRYEGGGESERSGAVPLGPTDGSAEAGQASKDVSKFSQADTPAPFFSVLAKALPKAPFAKDGSIPAGQLKMWLAARSKDGTFKQDELTWSGLNDYLDSLGTGRVTRDQVQSYLDQNGVKVEETLLGGKGGTIYNQIEDLRNELRTNGAMPDFDWEGRLQGLGYKGLYYQYVNDGYASKAGEWIASQDADEDTLKLEDAPALPETIAENARELGELRERVAQAGSHEALGETEYHGYQLPGGKNYKELLLTLPEKNQQEVFGALPDGWEVRPRTDILDGDGEIEAWATKQFYVLDGRTDVVGEGNTQAEAIADAQSAILSPRKMVPVKSGPTFQSSHFPQPNILAHVRFNERRAADGSKVLFIEEIQSDWAQAGRKQGFADKPLTREAISNKLVEHYGGDGADQAIKDVTEILFDHRDDPAAMRDLLVTDGGFSEAQARTFVDSFKTGVVRGVPHAPFVGKTEAWVALALKRMVKYAVDNGFDHIAWTNGEQQSERYDLSKQVTAITWNPVPGRGAVGKDVTIHLRASRNVEHGRKMKITISPEGVVTKHGLHAELKDKPLADIIGKALAEKVLSEEKGEAKGDGLKIGGEGMHAFYNKIVPNVANDLLKKAGGKVGEVPITTPRVSAADPTSDLAPFFAGPVVDEEGEETGDFQVFHEGDGDIPAQFDKTVDTFEEADALADAANEALTLKDAKTTAQPGFAITPEMRAAVSGGQPLFKQGAKPTKGINMDALDRFADRVRAKWKNAPEIVTVPTVADLPAEIHADSPDGKVPAGARGVFHDGKVYLVAENLKNARDAAFVVLHETVGHFGLKGILGARLDALMNHIYKTNPEVRALADKLTKKYGYNSTLATEEALSDMAGEGRLQDQPFWKQLVAAVRNGLRALGLDVAMSDADINDLLARSLRFVETGHQTAAHAAVAKLQAKFSRAASVDSAAFRQWFGKSTIVDENGEPKVMYHGTAQDIKVFRPKQANAIFVTDDPGFAEAFTTMSREWMETHQPGTDPAEQIMPVYVKAENPFDYANLQHVRAVIAERMKHPLPTDALGNAIRFKDKLRQGLVRGLWNTIEAPDVQAAIRAVGHDSFYALEAGRKNLGVYEPTQIKSAVGNVGTYDPANPDIRFSQTDTPAFKRWFADSTVVDEKGEPKVVYHGTNKDFSEFKTGRSAWFAADPKLANMFVAGTRRRAGNRPGKGSSVYPVYLRLVKPLDLGDRLPASDSSVREVLELAGLPHDPAALKALAKKALDSGDTRVAAYIPDHVAYVASGYAGKERLHRVLDHSAVLDELKAAGYDGIKMREIMTAGTMKKPTSADSTTYAVFAPTQIKSAISNTNNYDPANPKFSVADDVPAAPANKQTTTPMFKRWFGDSKIVDKDGKPRVAYKAMQGDVPHIQASTGMTHVALSRTVAENFVLGKKGRRVREVYVKAENPFDYRDAADRAWLTREMLKPENLALFNKQTRELMGPEYDYDVGAREMEGAIEAGAYQVLEVPVVFKMIRARGHDSLFVMEEFSFHETPNIALFSPTQIKEVSNQSPDPANPDIRYSIAPGAPPNTPPAAPGSPTTNLNQGQATQVPPGITAAQATTPTPGPKVAPWVAKMPAAQQEFLRKAGVWKVHQSMKQRYAEFTKNLGMRMLQGALDQYAPVLKHLGSYPYRLLRMAAHYSGAVEAMLFHGRVHVNSRGALDVLKGTKGFLDVLKPLNGESERFFAWVAAHRAEQLTKEQRENLFGDTDIKAGQKLNTMIHADDNFANGQSGKERAMVYARVLKDYNEFSKSVLDIAEKSGLINGEKRKEWERMFYVPFFREQEDDPKAFVPGNVSGMANQQAFKKLQGGTNVLQDLLANTINNWSHLIQASVKNSAAKETLQQAEAKGYAHQVKEHEAPKGSVFVMEDGKPVYYVVDDPMMLDAISSLAAVPFRGPGMKALTAMKHVLTTGVTISPTFRVRNVIRDQISAMAQNPTSYNLGMNLVNGLKYSSENNPMWGSQVAGGGMMRMGQGYGEDSAGGVKKLLDRAVDKATVLDTPGKVKDALDKAWTWWHETGARSESLTRANLYQETYKRLLKEGASADEAHAQASFVAADSLDFGLHGTSAVIRGLTQVVPFMNARLQGLYKLQRGAATDPKRFAAVLGAVTLATIALSLAYRDDEDYQKRDESDRDNFWWFKMGGLAYKIPKPFEVGALANIADRGLEAAMNGLGKEDRERFANSMMSTVANQLSMNPIPQAFWPAIQLWANKNAFTGRSIESVHDKNLSVTQRGERPTGVAQVASKAMNAVLPDAATLSPPQIDFLVNAYFGWLGAHAAATADLAVRPAIGMPDKPARKVDDYFVVGDFAKELPSSQSRFVEAFYDHLKETQQAVGDLRNLQTSGQLVKAAEMAGTPSVERKLAPMYEHMAREIGKIGSQIRYVNMSTMDPEAKRAKLDRLAAQRNAMAENVERARAKMLQERDR